MNAKYIGKTIALPKTVADDLLHVQALLTSSLGFTPSLSETVAYLVKDYREQQLRRQRDAREQTS